MRSRYSAYAKGLASYIVATTHPSSPASNLASILQFCQETKFQGLKIVEFIDGENTAYVTFIATLKQGGHDASFKEKSLFKKVNGRWLYLSGTFPGP